jgi:hypothetical protein
MGGKDAEDLSRADVERHVIDRDDMTVGLSTVVHP